MTETVLRLIAEHGPGLIFCITLLSATGLPIPGTLTVLAAGSFVASGEMAFGWVVAAVLVGTLVGDLIGYGIGARGGERAVAWAARRGMGPAVTRARTLSERYGDWGNFLCRWLFSPLAPAVNLLSGVVGMPLPRFLILCLLGEIVWAALYLGLGFAFSRSILAIARVSGDLGLFLVAAGGVILLAARLRRRAGSGTTT